MPAALAWLYAALVVDLVAGDPPNAVHPVAWLGRVAGAPIRLGLRLPAVVQVPYGAALVAACAVGYAWLGTAAVGALAGHPIAGFVAAALVLKSSFALRGLGVAAARVRDLLTAGRGRAARLSLRSLCSRDPHALTDEQVAAAAVESVAENLSDSFVAPVLYFALFGLPGALAYRAVNTLDAMIGYRDERERLGKPAARLDDLLNLIPSRLTAVLLIAVGRQRARGAAIWRRDAHVTASPNAGHPMAAMAGLLGVALDKPGEYRLGDDIHPVTPDTITRAWHLAVRAAALCTAIAIVVLGARGG